MELCKKCNQMTAERNLYTRKIICYNKECGAIITEKDTNLQGVQSDKLKPKYYSVSGCFDKWEEDEYKFPVNWNFIGSVMFDGDMPEFIMIGDVRYKKEGV